MGVGVAVSQPAFPSLVREWFPRRIAVATAVYSNGILIGETVPTGLTSPVGVLPLTHGDWRGASAAGSLGVLASGGAIVLSGPRRGPPPARPARVWASWREGAAGRGGPGLAFIVPLTVPPGLARAGDVHRMSAAVFTVQYATAFVLPLVAGSLWDLTGVAALAFAPGVAATAAMAWVAMSLRLGGAQEPGARRTP